ncbi:MAG: hypothetical protein ACK417_01740 [Bacteroidia bacterium]|jgi:hypothetical protein
MQKIKWLIVLALVFVVMKSKAQLQNPGSQELGLMLVKTNIGLYQTTGIMAERFGPGATVGLDIGYKSKKGWLFTISGAHMFGGDIRETDIMSNISTAGGDVITRAGVFEDYRLRQFGWLLYGKVGKIFPVIGPNPNSGLMLELGYGLMQHKIWIETPVNNSPQLSAEYKRGYDRLSNGQSINTFLGYQHLSDNKLINFYIGIDLHTGFTENRRTINYNTQSRDDRKRTDLMIGIRGGWILPLYKRAEKAMLFY